ncbi:glycine receptor subunit alphaZ1 [Trichonephila clavipes]|nr:glycine receptor subunit alphaZ1 [Trichonephila clavipes]
MLSENVAFYIRLTLRTNFAVLLDSLHDRLKHVNNFDSTMLTRVVKLQQESDDDEPVEEKNTQRVKTYGGTHKIEAKRIDQLCRTGFPVLFLIFNICYWPYYLI